MKNEANSEPDVPESLAESRRKGFHWLLIAIAGGGAACAGVGFLAWRSTLPTTYTVPAAPAPVSVGKAQFQIASEAEKYRSAFTKGQQRSIVVLEQALQRAQSQPSPNQELVRQLEAQLQRRRAQLREAASPGK